ncbi:hypothetical protein NEE14_008360 [Parabacteroides sp. AD58]|uniref:Transposase n=1 Tax=Parabacteroides absconsus TaxID=2951805 RepID=A0ABZ2IG96_9BACT|nr:hypothetical protein [Parabacteroides sp. AD58]MCM6902520.1 hypothetical protein [Parabacteroides sp. AD58]
MAFDIFQDQEKMMIPIILKGKKKLSGAQTTFNRLNKKIAKLKMIIDELPQRKHVIKKYFDEKRREALEAIRQYYMQISTGLAQEEINKKGLESM